MSLECPHKIAKKDGHLHEIAQKNGRLPYLVILCQCRTGGVTPLAPGWIVALAACYDK